MEEKLHKKKLHLKKKTVAQTVLRPHGGMIPLRTAMSVWWGKMTT
jgi:hypothetical protein